MTSDDESRDVAASVFSSINLLSIKRSVRLLLELETGAIEDFVKKYSGIMIFLLNILDQQRSFELLQKLNDSSIIYIVEEELRFLLIREIALIPMDAGPEVIVNLSALLEQVDKVDSDEEITEGIGLALDGIGRGSSKKSHFAYADALGDERLDEIILLLLRRNRHVAFGMLPYCSENVLYHLIEGIAGWCTPDLQFVPVRIMDKRFLRPHDELLVSHILQHLPAQFRERVAEIDAVKKRFSAEFAELERLASLIPESRAGAGANDSILNLIYGILKKIDQDTHDMLLTEFRRKYSLSESQIHILKTMI